MYEIFCDEMYESGNFTIESKIGAHDFILFDSRDKDRTWSPEFLVKLVDKEKITCSCSYFEHMGMLCRHSIKVITHFPVQNIYKKPHIQQFLNSQIPCFMKKKIVQ